MNKSMNSSGPEELELAAAISEAASPPSSSGGGGVASAASPSSPPGRTGAASSAAARPPADRAALVKALGLEEIKKRLRKYQGCLGGWIVVEKDGKLLFVDGSGMTALEADVAAHTIMMSTRSDGVWRVDVPEDFDPLRISMGIILGELDWLPFAATPVASES